MTIALAKAIEQIIVELKNTFSDERESIWEKLTGEIKENDSFNDELGYTIEEKINSYLEILSLKEKISLWKQTEAQNNHEITDDLLEMELQTELLVEIIEIAFEEADNKKRP